MTATTKPIIALSRATIVAFAALQLAALSTKVKIHWFIQWRCIYASMIIMRFSGGIPLNQLRHHGMMRLYHLKATYISQISSFNLFFHCWNRAEITCNLIRVERHDKMYMTRHLILFHGFCLWNVTPHFYARRHHLNLSMDVHLFPRNKSHYFADFTRLFCNLSHFKVSKIHFAN